MKSFFLFIYFAIASSIWRWSLVDATAIGQLNMVLTIVIFCHSLYSRSQIKIDNNYFSKYIDIFCFLPLLSFIGAYFVYDQTPIDSWRIWNKTCPIWLISYSLIKFQFTKRDIYKAIMYYTIVCGVLSILVTYNENMALMFASMDDNGNFEIRNGQIRYRIPGSSLVVFSYIFCLYRIIRRDISKLEIFTFLMSVMAIYAMQTRQILIAVALITAFICMNDKAGRKFGIAILLLATVYMFFNYDVLFGDFTEQTTSELEDDDSNRWKSLAFYSQQITSNILTFFTGFSRAAGDTQYGKIVEMWWRNNGVGAQDVGFVGTCFYYGVIYIFFYFKMVYVLGWEKRKIISPEISSFILCTFVYSVMIFPFSESGVHAALWGCLFYVLIMENNTVKLNGNVVRFDKSYAA